jgi:hypothetical protein
MTYLNDLSQRAGSDQKVSPEVLDLCFDQMDQTYDPVFGGFGDGPKFPRPVSLLFLLRHHARTGSVRAREMVEQTLEHMAAGGVYDHVGGGFHRYAVDREWRVPHFEKMLYDQAQLLSAYVAAYQLSGRGEFASTARGIAEYVLRDLSRDGGGFYSAEDADSPVPGRPGEHAEGAFYVWEENEIVALLGEKHAAVFNDYYGVEPKGNAPSDPHGEFRNKNILIVRHTVEDTASEVEISADEVRAILEKGRKRLFEARAKRPRPHLDDKTLTAWNGLMISAFARAYQVLGDASYLESARRATAFVRQHLYQEADHSLKRRYRAGEVAVEGFCDDYAFLIQGLLDVYEAGFDIAHLQWAVDLQEKQNALFWDAADGGYFTTSGQDKSVLLRIKDDYDGAEPSANSISALNLLRLAEFADNKDYRAMAAKTLAVFGTRMERVPSAVPQMLVAVDANLHKPVQVILAGKVDAEDTRALVRAVHGRFVPSKVMMLADGGAGQAYLGKRLAFLKGMHPIDGKATAYVCRDYSCQLPTTDVKVMLEQIQGK